MDLWCGSRHSRLAVTASCTLADEGSGASAASQIQAELLVDKEFISAETAS
jgi:hypothetical protein